MHKPNTSPFNLSKKYKCDQQLIYVWLRENHIQPKGGRYGEDYTIDAPAEKRFYEWLQERRKRPWTITAVAKRHNRNITTLLTWLKKHNLKFGKDIEQNRKIEKLFAERLRQIETLRQLHLSPAELSRKYHCDTKELYRWLEDNNIKQKGWRYGEHYVIDDRIERQFGEWLHKERERKKNKKSISANGVAKRSGCSRQLVCVWAKANGIRMEKRQYVFTSQQEKMFNKRKGRIIE